MFRGVGPAQTQDMQHMKEATMNEGETEAQQGHRMEPAGQANLEAALTADGTHVIFLHDPWCPISDRANAEMERVEHPMVVVDVSTQRSLSRLVADRTQVRHESPQVFVVKDGRVTWHASHGRITRRAVTAALGPTA